MRDGGTAVGLRRLPLHLAEVWTPVGDEGLAARVGHICRGKGSVRGFESFDAGQKSFISSLSSSSIIIIFQINHFMSPRAVNFPSYLLRELRYMVVLQMFPLHIHVWFCAPHAASFSYG